MSSFEITPHERIAFAAIARQLAVALREQADAADFCSRLAGGGGDLAYQNELPYLDSLAQSCGALRNAMHVLRLGPSKSLDTPRRVEGTKPVTPAGDSAHD